MPEDILNVTKTNVNHGGKQRVMGDGWWGGQPQKMNYALGVPKGLHRVLEERGMTIDGKPPRFQNERAGLRGF